MRYVYLAERSGGGNPCEVQNAVHMNVKEVGTRRAVSVFMPSESNLYKQRSRIHQIHIAKTT